MDASLSAGELVWKKLKGLFSSLIKFKFHTWTRLLFCTLISSNVLLFQELKVSSSHLHVVFYFLIETKTNERKHECIWFIALALLSKQPQILRTDRLTYSRFIKNILQKEYKILWFRAILDFTVKTRLRLIVFIWHQSKQATAYFTC